MQQFLLLFCVVFFTIVSSVRADDLPDLTETPKNKAVTVSKSEEAESEEYAVDSVERAEILYPSNWGHVGLFRVRSAESLPSGTLTFGLGGEFYTTNNAPNFGSGGSASTIAENLFFGFSPLESLTLGIQRRNSSTTFGNPSQLISSLGDFTFSGLYSVSINSAMAIAPIVNLAVASNFNNLAPAGTTLSAGLGAAFTMNLFPVVGVPFFAHVNAIYNMPQIRTSKLTTAVEPEAFFNFSRFHTVTIGIGAELKLGDFIPFLEFYDTVQTGTALNFAAHPSKISVGSRFTPFNNKGLALLLGADIGLGKGLTAGTPYNPDYQVLGQVSYTFSLSQTERKQYATTADVNIVNRKFIISRNINFKVGSAQLETDSYKLLDQIATVIKKNNVKKLMIVGHTDSSATEDYNLKLSQDRAVTVKTYLSRRGIPEETFLTQGYGKRKPKASNLSEEGRSLNRRVEFFILE